MTRCGACSAPGRSRDAGLVLQPSAAALLHPSSSAVHAACLVVGGVGGGGPGGRTGALAPARVVVPALLLGLVIAVGLKEHRKLRDATRSGSQHSYAAIAAALRSKLQPGDAIAYGGAGNAPNWARTATYFELQALEQACLRATCRDAWPRRGGTAERRRVSRSWLSPRRGPRLGRHHRSTRATVRARDGGAARAAASEFAVAEVTTLSKLTLALLVRPTLNVRRRGSLSARAPAA